MNHRGRPRLWLAALALTLGLGVLGTLPAVAQGQMLPTPPQWMQDSGFYFGQGFAFPFLENRYLSIWNYHQGNDRTKWVLWTNGGNPLTDLDDFFYNIRPDQNGNLAYFYPFGSQIFGNNTTRPLGFTATLRIDDPGATPPFQDFDFIEDGSPQAQFFFAYPDGRSGPVGIFSNLLGTYTRWVYSGGTGTSAYNLEIEQRVSFARDVLRIEHIVTNLGGNTRQVGFRYFLNPSAEEYGGAGSFFLPENRERVGFEKDFGRATGTTVAPRVTRVPREWEIYDSDNAVDPVFVCKGYFDPAMGATLPDRVVFGNALDITGTLWDYSIRPDGDLRQADPAVLAYYDPVSIAPGQVRRFVTYAGIGVVSHMPSGFYQTTPPGPSSSVGFVGAVQSPWALPLVNGDVDTQSFSVQAYMQSTLDQANPDCSVAFQLPTGLEFPDGSQSLQRDLGTLSRVSTARDEASTSVSVRANGLDAGLLPIQALFSSGIPGDFASVRRVVHVPQGRLYQFTNNYLMRSFPFTYTLGQADPSDVLGLPPGSVTVLEYNPVINDYQQASEIVPGKGYWIRMRGLGDTMVRLNNALPIDLGETGAYRILLRRGWNLIGNPSPYAVPVRNLQIVSPTRFLDFASAVQANLIRGTLWEFDRLRRDYVSRTSESVLNPGQAVWIFATDERLLLWPAPQGPGISITP